MKYLLAFLIFASTAQAQSFTRKVYILPGSVSCYEGLTVLANAYHWFRKHGIRANFTPYCVSNYSYPVVPYSQQEKLLDKLDTDFRARSNTHFMVQPFAGNLFSGVAYIGGRRNSLATAKPNRAWDNMHILIHELLHTLGARHDFSSCNIMGFYRTCSNPSLNKKARREIRKGK
jgi:hypothetical protein